MKAVHIFKLSVSLICISAATLFFAACSEECPHTYMSEVVVEPECEKQGRTVHYCLDCDYEYSSDFVPSTGHTLKEEIHEPTCTEQGYTYKYCDCGYHFNSDYVEPLGHTLSVEQTVATCDREGYKTADCSVCGLHYNYDIIPPLGHQLKADTTFVVSCKQDGSTTYVCDRDDCGFSYVGDYTFYSDIFTGAYVTSNTQPLAKGIDVSYHQHQADADGNYNHLDWAKIKAAGIDFAILRAGYMGSGNIGVTDPVYEMNYADAKAAGLDVGVYFYSYAYSVEDARAEAEFLMTLLEGKTFEYPIFFDLEDQNILNKNLTPQQLTDICVEFISTLQENGYYAALYTGNDWVYSYLQTSKVTTLFDIWYARWAYKEGTTVCNEWTWQESFGKQMSMWQFSATGQIEGVYYPYKKNDDGSDKLVWFDMNYAYKDYPSIIKAHGYNNYSKDQTTTNLDGKYSEGS